MTLNRQRILRRVEKRRIELRHYRENLKKLQKFEEGIKSPIHKTGTENTDSVFLKGVQDF